MQGVKSQKGDSSFRHHHNKLARGKFSYSRYGGGVAALLRVGALM